eukprot:349954-Chlamydomonas_euryale.AAC.2
MESAREAPGSSPGTVLCGEREGQGHAAMLCRRPHTHGKPDACYAGPTCMLFGATCDGLTLRAFPLTLHASPLTLHALHATVPFLQLHDAALAVHVCAQVLTRSCRAGGSGVPPKKIKEMQ